MKALAAFDPWWIEEPTSPDDVLGHAAIAQRDRADRGRHRRARARTASSSSSSCRPSAIGFCQVDACRMGGVNEVLAVLLLAARFGVPVCPHAGGVGLCEYVQHLSIFDYIAVSGSLEDRAARVRRPPARALRRPGARSATAATSRPSSPATASDEGRVARRVRVPGRRRVEVLIATPMPPEDAERIAAEEGVELTYLPELLPTAALESATPDGEGGVAARRPALEADALERAEVVFGHPRQLRRGAGRPRPARAAPRSGCRPATPAPASSSAPACALAPDELDGITVTTSSGVHAGPLAEFAIFGLLAFAKELPTAAARPARAPLARRPAARSASCAARRCCSSASARSGPRPRGWRARSACT